MIRTLKRSPPLRAESAKVPLLASWKATALFLFGLLCTGLTLHGESPSATARFAAVGSGLSLLGFAAVEIRRRWANLLRADLVSMFALYYLIFLEFLFPQPDFDVLSRNANVDLGIEIVLWGFGAMAVGRHLLSRRSRPWTLAEKQFPPSTIVALFWLCFAMGYLYMLASVNFDPALMIWYFTGPRFSAPWSRGRFGDAQALLFELGAMIYLVPPLAGIILGRRQLYPRLGVLLVLLALLLTFFYGFTTGTRSVMGAYLITFFVAYFYSASCSRKQIVQLGAVAAFVMVVNTIYGVQFRNMGLREYIRSGNQESQTQENFFVDYNLLSISGLVAVFPDHHPYLEWEVPEWFFVRVVPRALWPGKPDGTAISPDSYLDVGPTTTISATFVGEAYMGFGLAGSIVVGLLLGWLAAFWTRKAFSVRSDFGILLYGSGFFAVVITMRSLYMLPVASLPVLAVAVLGSLAKGRTPARKAVLARAIQHR
jgi:oligosaccharide repeat unit polymerase